MSESEPMIDVVVGMKLGPDFTAGDTIDSTVFKPCMICRGVTAISSAAHSMVRNSGNMLIACNECIRAHVEEYGLPEASSIRGVIGHKEEVLAAGTVDEHGYDEYLNDFVSATFGTSITGKLKKKRGQNDSRDLDGDDRPPADEPE